MKSVGTPAHPSIPALPPAPHNEDEQNKSKNQFLKPKFQNTAKISVGEDTYTIVGVPGSERAEGDGLTLSEELTVGGFRVIRRSGRWKRGSVSPTPNNTQEGCRSMEPGSAVSGPNEGQDGRANPDSPAACRQANIRLKSVLTSLQESGIDPASLVAELEYVAEVLAALASKAEETVTDDLSELTSEAVPDEVRKWLASTFAKQEQVVRRTEERPSFKSVANAIRTGIFIERIYRRMSTSQLIFIPPEVEKCLQGVDDWNFDVFSLSKATKGSPLMFLGYHLLQKHGCLHKYKIPPSLLETLLSHLELGYAKNSNPYHNNLHACDVLQTTHWFINNTGLKDWLSDLEVFALLFSAIVHDYDHSGTTNNFHIQSGSNMAILYNDRAVLENHHVAEFFKTMMENECNILNNMSKPEFREFRSLMIEMVLHTDMSMHFSQLKSLKSVLQSAVDGSSLDKTQVLSLLLHSCDVSHPSKRWELHHQWTSRCMEEFFRQGDHEKQLGLEFSPLCDRQNTMVPQSQIGFIDFIVAPTLAVATDTLNLILTGRKEIETPWNQILPINKAKWQAKAEAGETGIEESDATKDIKPPRVGSAPRHHPKPENGQQENEDPNCRNRQESSRIPFDNSHLIKQEGIISLQSQPPNKPTKHKDVSGDIPDSVISRPGSPENWQFDVKESLSMIPPRPETANILTPPEKRRAPISVDRKLRKNHLDF